MRLVFLPEFNALLIDIIAWVVIHVSVGYWSAKIPARWFNPEHLFYRTHPWEKGGEIYQRIFRVRSWKKFIPNGRALYPNTFSLQKMPTLTREYLERWLRESCRAEFCHWLMIVPGFFFFLWNSVEMGWGMVVYAVLNNLVPIVMQRFNRPRIRRMLAQINLRSLQQTLTAAEHDPETFYIGSYC